MSRWAIPPTCSVVYNTHCYKQQHTKNHSTVYNSQYHVGPPSNERKLLSRPRRRPHRRRLETSIGLRSILRLDHGPRHLVGKTTHRAPPRSLLPKVRGATVLLRRRWGGSQDSAWDRVFEVRAGCGLGESLSERWVAAHAVFSLDTSRWGDQMEILFRRSKDADGMAGGIDRCYRGGERSRI